MRLLALLVSCVFSSYAADWSTPEQQLARKIFAITGAGATSLSFNNLSSLSRRDSEIIQNGLRSALEGMGLRFAPNAPNIITISLSENLNSYVWVAEIKPQTGDSSVVTVSIPRSPSSTTHDSVPLTLRKMSVWEQSAAILDVAVLEENAVPSRIAVLGPEGLSLYRMQSGKWQREQSVEIAHANTWPRDLRGRLVPGNDHLLDIYMPGVFCQTGATAPLSLRCRESNDPWPLVARPISPAMAIRATYASGRNFFTGSVPPGFGGNSNVPPFYSAVPAGRDTGVFWILTGIDRDVHLVDGANDRVIRPDWGSDVATVKTQCGAGWQLLATNSGEGDPDTVRAYEFPDRDPVLVSAAIDFAGPISAFWTEAKGDTAIAVVHKQESGSYEAFRLAVACSQ